MGTALWRQALGRLSTLYQVVTCLSLSAGTSLVPRNPETLLKHCAAVPIPRSALRAVRPAATRNCPTPRAPQQVVIVGGLGGLAPACEIYNPATASNASSMTSTRTHPADFQTWMGPTAQSTPFVMALPHGGLGAR